MLDVIRNRRSYRTFLKRDVEAEKLDELLKAAMFSPNSRGLMPWEFIIVKDDETKRALARSTAHSKFAKNAPLVIVICYDTTKNRRFKEDASIAAAHIYLEAEHQGLGTCFIQIPEAFKGEIEDPEAYVKDLLDIPEHYRVQCLMPVGYPAKRLEPYREDQVIDPRKIHNERFTS